MLEPADSAMAREYIESHKRHCTTVLAHIAVVSLQDAEEVVGMLLPGNCMVPWFAPADWECVVVPEHSFASVYLYCLPRLYSLPLPTCPSMRIGCLEVVRVSAAR